MLFSDRHKYQIEERIKKKKTEKKGNQINLLENNNSRNVVWICVSMKGHKI